MNRIPTSEFQPFAPFSWQLARGRQIELGPRAIIMGILNVTPDSFSDGGRYAGVDAAVEQARRMSGQGAAIIDVGGESTRPGAEPVSAEEERSRVLPVIEALAGDPAMLISVDTYRAETASLALAAGAHVVNDVWGFQKEPAMASVVAKTGAGCIIMHTGRERQRASDVVADQYAFLQQSLAIARTAGVDAKSIVIDPGFGFGKDWRDNFNLLAQIDRLLVLGQPVLCGTSRKRFLGHVTGREPEDRDVATAATSVIARMKGAAIFRVHDVASNRDALAVADAVLAASRETAT